MNECQVQPSHFLIQAPRQCSWCMRFSPLYRWESPERSGHLLQVAQGVGGHHAPWPPQTLEMGVPASHRQLCAAGAERREMGEVFCSESENPMPRKAAATGDIASTRPAHP